MNSAYFEKLETALAAERLEAYGVKDNADQLTKLARYLQNMALCGSLYSPLQIAEVALRNSIHSALSQKAETENWFDEIELIDWQKEKLADAKRKLKEEKKDQSPGRIVAGLDFGFWTGFFNKAHGRSGIPIYLIKTAFPFVQDEYKDLKHMGGRWQNIRNLRNRVFHHERLIHWSDLDERHKKLIATIGWMSPELQEMAIVLDHYTLIRKNGLSPWIKKIRMHWPKE